MEITFLVPQLGGNNVDQHAKILAFEPDVVHCSSPLFPKLEPNDSGVFSPLRGRDCSYSRRELIMSLEFGKQTRVE